MTFRMTASEVQAHQRKLEKWRSGSQPGRKPTKTPDTFAYQAAAIENGLLTVWLPIRLVNGANAREHWATRRKRAEAHKDIVAQAIPRNLLPPLPAQVTITRYGPRLMDDDGYSCGVLFKGNTPAFKSPTAAPAFRRPRRDWLSYTWLLKCSVR